MFAHQTLMAATQGKCFTQTFYPSASGDDFNWVENETIIVSDKTYFAFGKSSYNYKQHSLCRYALSIPRGASIVSAYLRCDPASEHAESTVSVAIAFCAEDSASLPTTVSQAEALSLTSSVAWNAIEPWYVGTIYQSPDIAGPLQEVISRAGWTAGNSAIIVIRDTDSTTNSRRSAKSFDNDGKGVGLSVSWRQ